MVNLGLTGVERGVGRGVAGGVLGDFSLTRFSGLGISRPVGFWAETPAQINRAMIIVNLERETILPIMLFLICLPAGK
jgi:hypothetical protein